MKQSAYFTHALLDHDLPERAQQTLWNAGVPGPFCLDDTVATLPLPLHPMFARGWDVVDHENREPISGSLRVQALGPEMLRITVLPPGTQDKSLAAPMFTPESIPAAAPLRISEDGTQLIDDTHRPRVRSITEAEPIRPWREGLIPEPQRFPRLTFYPDGSTPVRLLESSKFYGPQTETLPLVFPAAGDTPDSGLFSLHAEPDEHFVGTGERFAGLDLSGKTLQLENTDALGVNNRRAYKNVPFFLSSRGYGVLLNTSHAVRISFKDVCTRAVITRVEEPVLDVILIGGGSPEAVLRNYRTLTGFPPPLPRWTYGTWMSRMTYFSAGETHTITDRMRAEKFPCDVLHLDTGWFDKDWVCEWTFNKERFPDPAGYMREMREKGYRITLWQTPNIGSGNKLLSEARKNRYLAPIPTEGIADSGSDFSDQRFAGQIDFSNPEAVEWYQGLLRPLLDMGAAAIKTDFGEDVDGRGQYAGMPAAELHNLYALLYQKAAFDITKAVTGEGVIWARAGWTGCQRYPIHWGGDAACTWDGLAGSIRGGLHLGLSGFGHWSHDVPGFHGIPDFMSHWPSEDLYLRWTQFGVFSSHLRYHGTSPREPYEYPGVADAVRKWLNLRYALIPYLEQQADITSRSGMPMLRALLLMHPEDRTCWLLDNQFYLGDAFLVAPILNESGQRDVYLPAGNWVDFWTGKCLTGEQWIRGRSWDQEHLPVFVRDGSSIPVYPQVVQHTGEMQDEHIRTLEIDESYNGLADSLLGYIGL